VADTCECGNEPPISIICGEILDKLRIGYLLKMFCAAWSEEVCKLISYITWKALLWHILNIQVINKHYIIQKIRRQIFTIMGHVDIHL
jgi:hypothetical protein